MENKMNHQPSLNASLGLSELCTVCTEKWNVSLRHAYSQKNVELYARNLCEVLMRENVTSEELDAASSRILAESEWMPTPKVVLDNILEFRPAKYKAYSKNDSFEEWKAKTYPVLERPPKIVTSLFYSVKLNPMPTPNA